MAHDIDALPKGAGAWGQAVTAVVMIAVLAGGLWAYGEVVSQSAGSKPYTPSCEDDGKPGATPPEPGKASRQLTGQRLCEALFRPDLAALLGTPGEAPSSVTGSDGSRRFGSDEEVATPSAEVEFPTYTVTLTASYDGLPTADTAEYLRGAQEQKILGRPAVVYSDRTISISFRLDGSDARSGPGVPARTLMVAQDARDSGGSYDVTLWRTDGATPDDATLRRVAEKVLPALPGWQTAR